MAQGKIHKRDWILYLILGILVGSALVLGNTYWGHF